MNNLRYTKSEAGNITAFSDGRFLFVRIIDLDTNKTSIYMTDDPNYSEKTITGYVGIKLEDVFKKIDEIEDTILKPAAND